MKMKFENLLEAKPALEILLQKNMSVAKAYKVSKLVKAVNDELKEYDELRIKALKDMGCELSADGSKYEIPTGKQEVFLEKIQELLSLEVDLPDGINISDEDLSMTPQQMLSLDGFLIFDE